MKVTMEGDLSHQGSGRMYEARLVSPTVLQGHQWQVF